MPVKEYSKKVKGKGTMNYDDIKMKESFKERLNGVVYVIFFTVFHLEAALCCPNFRMESTMVGLSSFVLLSQRIIYNKMEKNKGEDGICMCP
ncbi:LOW QUALITY PROTEIN: hypothetical protein TorRG33x02_157230 [Trema orientale]|uniref:Transmembrane protein n=1 Tax=Trema orientale TaxID=63057 RepID=A0A2P5ESI4_TREOI|nr:LOW QUALITY PROTEIN: hypothetical protein TorRG33x02_157230 [Trema orientale]